MMTEGDSTLTVGSEHEDDRRVSLDYSKKKRRILVWMLAYAALLGVFENFVPSDGPTSIVIFCLPWLVLTLQWCLLDATEHHFQIGKFLRIGLVLMSLIALPIYLFRTRGLAGVKSIVLACLFYVALCACNASTGYLTSVILSGRM